MTARELNPELRRVAYTYINAGACPNTGLPCENVVDLRMRLSAGTDSMALAGNPDLPLSKATTESFYRTSDEVHRTFDRSLVDTEACLGGCALLIVGQDQQSEPQGPEQQTVH